MKITPQARRRLLVFGSASIIIMVFFVFLTVSYIKTVSSLNTELNRLNLLLVQLENRNEDLQIEITRLHDPEYLARYVRENYDYSKDGELIIKINETNKSIDTLNEKEYSNKLFLIIISIIFIFMIFIYIIFKSKSVKKPITKK